MWPVPMLGSWSQLGHQTVCPLLFMLLCFGFKWCYKWHSSPVTTLPVTENRKFGSIGRWVVRWVVALAAKPCKISWCFGHPQECSFWSTCWRGDDYTELVRPVGFPFPSHTIPRWIPPGDGLVPAFRALSTGVKGFKILLWLLKWNCGLVPNPILTKAWHCPRRLRKRRKPGLPASIRSAVSRFIQQPPVPINMAKMAWKAFFLLTAGILNPIFPLVLDTLFLRQSIFSRLSCSDWGESSPWFCFSS